MVQYDAAMRLCWIVPLILAACHRPDFDPAQARSPYPRDLHSTDTVGVEVFRDDATIEIVNATATSWGPAIIWLNQRYSAPISGLDAGQSLRMDLVSFRDNIGERYPAGGIWSVRKTVPVRLVELQPGEGEPLVGFIAIRGGRVP